VACKPEGDGPFKVDGPSGLWHRLPVALYRATPDGRLTDANDAFVALLGYPGRDSMLRTAVETLQADPQTYRRQGSPPESTGPLRRLEVQLRRHDGTTFWGRESTWALRDESGATCGYEGLVEDITEYKQAEGIGRAREESAEKALQASEVRYRRLFEAARDGILILDAATAEIVDVNPFLCTLLGLPREQILGRKLWDIGSFRDVKACRSAFAELQDKEYVRYEDLPLETAHGRRVDVEFVSNVYHVNGDRVIQCNVRDITERKRAEGERAHLSRAVEQAGECILITDPQADIVYVNPAFERLSGYTRDEVLGRNPKILKSGLQDAGFYRDLWEVLARGDIWAGRLVNRRKDGSLVEQEGTISPVRDGAGRLTSYVAVTRDVTLEKRLEQQLSQAQKMEAVGRLAGGVAHDFNNVLGVITGYSEIVLKRLPVDDPLRDKLEQILKAADRAARLTHQLLAFSRKQVLQPRVVDLNVSVSDMETMVRRLIGEDIELVTALHVELGRVRADPGQVEQVILNLVVNARDAMPEGGLLTIRTRHADVSAASSPSPALAAGRYVVLAVSDTGSGMDAQTQAHIFEPFFTTKGIGKGTGLGLATVYGIVRQSDGDVLVDSQLGMGTTFEAYLPRVDAELALAPEERPLRARRGNETVLLVEDESMLREVLRETLEDNGYRVLVARDGAEALQAADGHSGPIALLITDVIMPGFSGLKVVERIMPTRPGMKVLYISGYSDESVLQHGMVAPGRAFLSKPFTSDVFLHELRGLLDER